MPSCQPASSHSLIVISSILPPPTAISTSSLQTMREVTGQGDLQQHSDLHQVSVKLFILSHYLLWRPSILGLTINHTLESNVDQILKRPMSIE